MKYTREQIDYIISGNGGMQKHVIHIIQQLLAENDSLRKENSYLNDACSELESNSNALREDAERYQWLREDGVDRSDIYKVCIGEDLDKAIDAARKPV